MPQFKYNLIRNFFSSIQRTKEWGGGCRKFAKTRAIGAELILYIAAGAIKVYRTVGSLRLDALASSETSITISQNIQYIKQTNTSLFCSVISTNASHYATRSEAPRQKTGGSGFDSQWGPWEFSIDMLLLFAFVFTGAHSTFNGNEHQGIALEDKCGRSWQLCHSSVCRIWD
jgi:hypothetical protein